MRSSEIYYEQKLLYSDSRLFSMHSINTREVKDIGGRRQSIPLCYSDWLQNTLNWRLHTAYCISHRDVCPKRKERWQAQEDKRHGWGRQLSDSQVHIPCTEEFPPISTFHWKYNFYPHLLYHKFYHITLTGEINHSIPTILSNLSSRMIKSPWISLHNETIPHVAYTGIACQPPLPEL